MDKRSARRKGRAIIRLEREVDSIAGRAIYSNGQRVYGARRIQAERRAAVTQMLMAEQGSPVPTERTTPEPSVSAENTPPVARDRTTPKSGRGIAAIGRAACVIVGLASIVAGLAIEGSTFGLLASLPAPKLIAAALGRAA